MFDYRKELNDLVVRTSQRFREGVGGDWWGKDTTEPLEVEDIVILHNPRFDAKSLFYTHADVEFVQKYWERMSDCIGDDCPACKAGLKKKAVKAYTIVRDLC